VQPNVDKVVFFAFFKAYETPINHISRSFHDGSRRY